DLTVTGVQTCALPIFPRENARSAAIVGHAAPIQPQRESIVGEGRGRVAPPPAAVAERPVIVRRQPAANAQRSDSRPIYRAANPRSEERRVGKAWRSTR